jgi:hypothetical protein
VHRWAWPFGSKGVIAKGVAGTGAINASPGGRAAWDGLAGGDSQPKAGVMARPGITAAGDDDRSRGRARGGDLEKEALTSGPSERGRRLPHGTALAWVCG